MTRIRIQVRHGARLILEAMRYASATRRFALAAILAAGLLILLATAATQLLVPVAIYPFV